MKVSEITSDELVNYLKLDPDYLSEAEISEINVLLEVSKEFIKSYTGLTIDEIDTHVDMVIVVYILVQDMYDNRAYYVDNTHINRTVQCILNMHCVNLL